MICSQAFGVVVRRREAPLKSLKVFTTCFHGMEATLDALGSKISTEQLRVCNLARKEACTCGFVKRWIWECGGVKFLFVETVIRDLWLVLGRWSPRNWYKSSKCVLGVMVAVGGLSRRVSGKVTSTGPIRTLVTTSGKVVSASEMDIVSVALVRCAEEVVGWLLEDSSKAWNLV